MNGIRIKDLHPRGCLSFDLKDLLEIIKDEITVATWCCECVEATAISSPYVENLSSSGVLVSTKSLAEAANNTNQVIDGIFTAYINGVEWLRIEAIDSTYWEVYSIDQDVLSKIQGAFKDTLSVSS